MWSIIASLFFVAAANAITSEQLTRLQWDAWKTHHKMNYTVNEERFRFRIFLENKARIAEHNARAYAGEETFFLKMNRFGDKLGHEISETMNGWSKGFYQGKDRKLGATFIMPENVEIPKSVDWRKKGAVTPVKDQGNCGSCWAFSATGALEGQHFRKTGELVSLSEQNLVDCSRKYGNGGCHGGLMDKAFEYVKDNKGIDTEESYPYEGKDRSCRYNKKNVGAIDVGFVDIPEDSDEKLMQAVATMGPISVAIDASSENFMYYYKGIYSEKYCSSEQLNHGVLLVGYGSENGHDYWIVKNSWGTSWGEDGYIRMSRGKTNMCGISSMASYPIV